MTQVVIQDTQQHHHRAQIWCLEELGLDSQLFLHGVWNCNTVAVNGNKMVVRYCFQDSKTALMFALKWKYCK